MKFAESAGIKDEVDPQGADLDRRQRRRRQGRRRQGRHRHRADHRHPRQGRQAGRPPARADPALDGLFGGDPGRAAPIPPPARAFVAAMTAPAMHERWVKAGWQPPK